MQKRSAFTLIELAVVISIFAVISTMGIYAFEKADEGFSEKETRANLDKVEEALQNFLKINKRLPCPANITLATWSSTYSAEVTSNECPTQPVCSTTTASDNSNIFIGSIPAATLNIPAAYMVDGWGNKIIYAVDGRFTKPNCTDPTKVNADFYTNNPAITVISLSGTTKTTEAIYFLASQGLDQKGARTKNGTSIAAPSSSTEPEEYENIDGDKTFSDLYLGTNDTDDITRYALKDQLILATDKTKPFAGAECACTTKCDDVTTIRSNLCFGY